MESKRISWPGWETVRLIGRGSFGAVYEIQRDIFGDIEKAALKVISIPQNASDIDEMYSDGYDEESITSTFKSHLRSIVAEYSMMRKMNGSANIVNCDDVRYVQHDDGIGWDIFIKMELLTPLTKALPAQVSEETVINIAKDICKALELCKKHEIVHRDIKPQNIFVSPNGDYKLGDFGIAKTVEKTMGGTKIGTYKYMAPEVYNNKPYGSAADIYSLGLVLYWLLNERRMPFLPLPPAKLSSGMDEQARNRRITGEQFEEPKNGSTELKAIIMKACAYNTEDRYTSAYEMLADLRRLGQTQQPAAVHAAPKTAEQIEIEADGDRTTGLLFKPETKPAKKKPEVQETIEPEEKTVGLFFSTINLLENGGVAIDLNKGNTQQAEYQNKPRIKPENQDLEEQETQDCPALKWDEQMSPAGGDNTRKKKCIVAFVLGALLLIVVSIGLLSKLNITKKQTETTCKDVDTDMLVSTDSGESIEFVLRNGKKVEGTIQLLDSPIESCSSISLCLKIHEVTEGNVWGEWGFYIRDTNGNWRCADTFVLEGDYVEACFEFDEPISIDAWTCLCHSLGDQWNFSLSVWLESATQFVNGE